VRGNLIAKYLSSNLLSKPYSRDDLLRHVRRNLDQEHDQVWTAGLATGVEAIDEDHRVLFTLLNTLATTPSSEHNYANIKAIQADLTRYALQHFRREEVMKACGYPKLDEHAQNHRDFERRLSQLVEKSNDQPSQEMFEEIFQYLKAWLVTHISVMDKDIQNYVSVFSAEITDALNSVSQELEIVA
jgi:hemerythrin